MVRSREKVIKEERRGPRTADRELRAERPGQVAWQVDGFSPEARYWRVRAPPVQEGLDTVTEIARIGGLP